VICCEKTFIRGNEMAECPVCGAEVTLPADAEEGEIITCADCGSELEVTGKDSVQEAPQEEEDWGE
jgi:alpha-aminoadipate carrier protein LysW